MKTDAEIQREELLKMYDDFLDFVIPDAKEFFVAKLKDK